MISVLLPSHNEPHAKEIMQEIEDLIPLVSQIIVCNDRDARGKGWAVREALAHATGEFIVFLDADGDIPPKMIKRLLPYLEDYDIVCGTKAISGIYSRRILTFLSRIYIYLLFDVKVDTQTGIKLFKREAIADWNNNGWLFDLEILSIAKQKGYSMIEVPIEANVSKKMHIRSVWNTLKESIELKIRLMRNQHR